MLNGCYSKVPSYEAFAYNKDYHIGKNHVPKSFGTENRKIYDENRYIYISEGPKGCIYGFLTNRDDKSEVVQEWIIISGKEYCKGIIHWSLF